MAVVGVRPQRGARNEPRRHDGRPLSRRRNEFYDALEVSQLPIVCSHSSARALCDHPRNLTDDQLRALAANGGVAQCTFYAGFLRTDDENATIDDALRHLLHMISVAGIDHVGIGTDFDGDGGVPGLANASELIQLTRRLQAEASRTKISPKFGAATSFASDPRAGRRARLILIIPFIVFP